MKVNELKVGDYVTRYIGNYRPLMEMVVTHVDDKLITCGAIDNGRIVHGGWTFDRATGIEEDEELQWGVKYGATGTFIKPKVVQ